MLHWLKPDAHTMSFEIRKFKKNYQIVFVS
jgi:hypothetical protein